ncbi:MAG: SGNH/GDSL hydrolase family protein [Acidobacteria bacterium]|nr:SGNH/GDSL hydrolase family protein [Acidobacteriota bacterium]
MNPGDARGGRTGVLAKLGLAAAAAVLALLLGEAALRIAGISYPNFYRPDADRGWALRPGAEGWWHTEGRAWVHISSAGLRDVEHAAAKPVGRLRIAVLGDSCAEALQVPVEQTFWKLLERRLASCPAAGGRAVEELDFGVAGYGTAQELLTLRRQVWRFQPDVVLLAFYPGNDVRNNARPLEQDPLRPYFTLGPDGRLALDDSFRAAAGYRLRQTAAARLAYGAYDHLRLLQVAKQGKSVVDGWIGAAKARSKEEGAALQELGLDNAVYSPPRDRDWGDAWKVTEAMIAAMRDDTAARRVPFGVVVLSTGIQVHPDPAARAVFMRKLGLADLFYPGRRLAAFGRAAGIPVLDLGPPLQQLAERGHVFLHGFANTPPGEGHWNARGHAAAAGLIATWLCRELLLPVPELSRGTKPAHDLRSGPGMAR